MYQKRIQGSIYGMMSPAKDVPRLLELWQAGPAQARASWSPAPTRSTRSTRATPTCTPAATSAGCSCLADQPLHPLPRGGRRPPEGAIVSASDGGRQGFASPLRALDSAVSGRRWRLSGRRRPVVGSHAPSPLCRGFDPPGEPRERHSHSPATDDRSISTTQATRRRARACAGGAAKPCPPRAPPTADRARLAVKAAEGAAGNP